MRGKFKLLRVGLLACHIIWHRFQARESTQSAVPTSAREGSVDTISIVIPAYNAEDFLARAVGSALQQTYPVLEVIIVDDGSNDDTRNVAGTLERKDSRVKLIALPVNGGPSKARNAGFAAAKGDWIAVLDADDAYMPDRLIGMLAISDGADIVADNFRFYDPKRDRIGAPGAQQIEGSETIGLLSFVDARRDHEDFGVFQPMFRRRFLERHRLRYLEDLRHGEDFLLMLEALARGAVFRITWHPGYLYTTRKSGWSRTKLDYKLIADTLRVVSDRNDLELSPEVRTKLRDRANHAIDLELREEIKSAVRRRKFLRAVALAATHPVVWNFALLKAKRKLARL